MDIAVPTDTELPSLARVNQRVCDTNGIPTETVNHNSILDSQMYEIEYLNRYKASLSGEAIAMNLFA